MKIMNEYFHDIQALLSAIPSYKKLYQWQIACLKVQMKNWLLELQNAVLLVLRIIWVLWCVTCNALPSTLTVSDQHKQSVRTVTKHSEPKWICGWMEPGHAGPRGGGDLTSGLTTRQSAVSHKAKREREGSLIGALLVKAGRLSAKDSSFLTALCHIWKRMGPQ